MKAAEPLLPHSTERNPALFELGEQNMEKPENTSKYNTGVPSPPK